MKLPRVLIAEPSVPVCNALRKFLEERAEVQSVSTLQEAASLCRDKPPEVLIAGVSETLDGEALATLVRKHSPDLCIVLVYPPEEDASLERATAANADCFINGPLKRWAVLNAVRAALKLRELRIKVAELNEAVSKQSATVEPVKSKTGFNTSDEAFFKKYILLEVKRSRRYQYPVSLLILSMDASDRRGPNGGSILAEALAVTSSMLRDIDVAMPFANEKLLVFLPHTGRSGSIVVAERLVARLRSLKTLPNGSASCGVATYEPSGEPKAQVSFGALVKEASEAMKRAQTQGGGRAEASVLADSKLKRSRISLG